MFTGVGTALITPFDDNYNVDYEALKNITRFQVESNIDALIVLGTTGESPVISNEERKKIISIVSEIASGKIRVIVGTGSNDTKHVIELNKIAEELNADGLLIVNPYYNKGTQEGLVIHYKTIAEKTQLPIMLYNVPSRTGMNLLPETIVKIHESCSNVVAVKEASGSISQVAQLMAIKSDSLTVFSGNDDQALPIMALGGLGVISVFSNAFPKELKKITNSFFNNDLKAAQNFSNAYLNMMTALFIETNPIPIKYVMSKLGFCKNSLRLPLTPASIKTEKYIDDQLEKLKAISL